MKSITRGMLAVALLCIPSIAMAISGKARPAPGQSEWAPGQRAKGPGDAKNFAPGQRCTRMTSRASRAHRIRAGASAEQGREA